MLRRVAIAAALVAILVLAGGVAVARSTPNLGTSGPTSVTGTEESAVFNVAERAVRQVRYADGGTLGYTFTLTNHSRVPVSVLGLDPDQPDQRLFHFLGLEGPGGDSRFSIGGGDSAEVTLLLDMGGCETLSSRSGSFVTEFSLLIEQAGIFDRTVQITLPEELHTGSPREAFCPNSTATSRPPG
ncbi:hypothetical protein [Nocardioides sp.]|uniref:hypothetical protein n=1 Tax=Nocardioides sp. TaxID=35761 RepID=UPI00356276FA